MTLRDYQLSAISRLRAELLELPTGNRSVLLVMPTGGGKTIIASEIICSHLARNSLNRVLFMAHRRELVSQSAATLLRDCRLTSLDVRRVQGADVRGPSSARITVASIQTLITDRWITALPLATLVIFDEAHHMMAAEWQQLATHYTESVMVGLTATPERSDGSPLGDIFQRMVVCTTIAELTSLGHLVPCRVIAPETYRTHMADDPAEAYHKHVPGQKAIVFCSDIGQAHKVRDGIRALGYSSETVTGQLNAATRAAILGEHQAGRVDVLTNVGVLTEGYDDPSVTAAVMARGCEHGGLFLQIVGRILRPCAGKQLATLVDLRGVVHKHGMPSDERVFSLEGRQGVASSSDLPALRQCLECGSTFRSAPVCPICGAMAPARKAPEVRLAEMREFFSKQPPEKKAESLRKMEATAAERGYRYGWVVNRYRAIYGETPPRAVSVRFAEADR